MKTESTSNEKPVKEVLCAGGCRRKVAPGSDGYCYECLCDMHASGEFNMDDTSHLQVWEHQRTVDRDSARERGD